MTHAFDHPVFVDDLDDLRDATALRVVCNAFLVRAESEQALGDAVVQARHDGHSWASIGAMVSISGEHLR